MKYSPFCIFVALIAASGTAAPPNGHSVHYSAELKATDEPSASAAAGKGKVEATLDRSTGLLKYKITYQNLTGPATKVDFQKLTTPLDPAPAVTVIADLSSPIGGSQALPAEQIRALTAGELHLIVHTSAHPEGEIQGQLVDASRTSKAKACVFPKCNIPQNVF